MANTINKVKLKKDTNEVEVYTVDGVSDAISKGTLTDSRYVLKAGDSMTGSLYMSSVVTGRNTDAGTNIDGNSLSITGSDNPFLQLKDNSSDAVDYYIQVYQNTFSLGTNWNTATKWDQNGNLFVNGNETIGSSDAVKNLTVYGDIYEGGTALSNKYAKKSHTHSASDISGIGNGTITITQNGATKGTFTVNQSGNTTVALTDTNVNTSHNHSAGTGLIGSGSAGTTGGTYNYKAALVNETKNAAGATYSSATDKLYAVQVDKNGKLAVQVPWTDHTYTIPTVNNAKITIKDADGEAGSFTLNQSADKVITIDHVAKSEASSYVLDNVSNSPLYFAVVTKDKYSELEAAGTLNQACYYIISDDTSLTDALANYLPLSGGELRGSLIVDKSVEVKGEGQSGNCFTVDGNAYFAKAAEFGVPADGSHGGILFDSTKGLRLEGKDSNLIINAANAVRFSDTKNAWYDVCAGLKYDSTNKYVYLGIADGTIFTSNTNGGLSGGKIYTPGISNIYIGSGTSAKAVAVSHGKVSVPATGTSSGLSGKTAAPNAHTHSIPNLSGNAAKTTASGLNLSHSHTLTTSTVNTSSTNPVNKAWTGSVELNSSTGRYKLKFSEADLSHTHTYVTTTGVNSSLAGTAAPLDHTHTVSINGSTTGNNSGDGLDLTHTHTTVATSGTID